MHKPNSQAVKWPSAPFSSFGELTWCIYMNLISTPWLQSSYNENSIREGSTVNVSINCSCRNVEINKYDGLFLTYPLMNSTTDSLFVLIKTNNVPSSYLIAYNLSVDFANSRGIAFVPREEKNKQIKNKNDRLQIENAHGFVLLLGLFLYIKIRPPP